MQQRFHFFAIALIAGALSALTAAAAERFRVTVAAGDLAREHVVVSFPLPPLPAGAVQLRDDAREVPVQVDAARRAWFTVDKLGKGESRTFQLSAAAGQPAPGPAVETLRDGGTVKIAVRGKPVLHYNAEKTRLPRENIKAIYQRGGYLHPVFTPAGRVVTDHYPPNHLHQQGIWWAWTKTDFEGRAPDFWNMGEGKGTVEVVALDDSWSGAMHGGFRARHRFVDLTAPAPKPALTETWEVRVFATPAGARHWLFDFTSTQECASASALKLPQHYYGGLGVRGNWAWNGRTNVNFLTSDGETDRVKGNATRGRWCAMHGPLDGGVAGLTILGHPDNFRFPQPMRLHPAEPFFCFAPQQGGDMEIAPGKPYVSRYRFVIHDGPPDAQEIERLWRDFAQPPTVTVAPE
jgi:hypothetical protein